MFLLLTAAQYHHQCGRGTHARIRLVVTVSCREGVGVGEGVGGGGQGEELRHVHAVLSKNC